MRDEKAGLGWKVLSFFVPIVGFILYFAWRGTRPRAAKGVLIAGLLNILLYSVIPAIMAGLA